MPNPEIELDAETFTKLKEAGIPDWVLPLDEIKEGEVKRTFERMRSEYRELAPPFLALFESDPEAMTAEESDRLNYALFFAAEFEDERFSEALLQLLRAEEESLEFLLGDFLTEAVDDCIGRICWRDLEGIKALALDSKADRYARWTALDSFKWLLWCERYTAERLKEELRDVIARLEDPGLWDAVTSLVTSLGWGEFEEVILEAYTAGNLESGVFGDADEIRRLLESGKDSQPYSGKLDAVVVLENYWEWNKAIAAEVDEAEEMMRVDGAADRMETPDGYKLDEGGGLMRDAEKVGRNDPCPCGSGKKFKKCCG